MVQLNDRDGDAVAEILTRFAEMLEAPVAARRRDAMGNLIGWTGEARGQHLEGAKRLRSIADGDQNAARLAGD